jgi:hypothetical protein
MLEGAVGGDIPGVNCPCRNFGDAIEEGSEFVDT